MDKYWTCKIGPIPEEDLPEGADQPLRMATQEAFRVVFGKYADTCESGWGKENKGD